MINPNEVDKPLNFKHLEYYDRKIKEHMAEVLNANCLVKFDVESNYDSLINRRSEMEDGKYHIPDVNIIFALIDKINSLEARLDKLEHPTTE